jgi:hypothetical protein
MHEPSEGGPVRNILASAGGASSAEKVQFASVTPEPTPVGPTGFSALAGLLGIAGGMVLAPWLERWYQKVTNHDREDHND